MLEDALKGLRIARPARQHQSALNAQDRIFSPPARLGCGATGARDYEGRQRLDPVRKGGSDVFVEEGTSLPEGQGVQEARFAALHVEPVQGLRHLLETRLRCPRAREGGQDMGVEPGAGVREHDLCHFLFPPRKPVIEAGALQSRGL
jgi:hypothetical protein